MCAATHDGILLLACCGIQGRGSMANPSGWQRFDVAPPTLLDGETPMRLPLISESRTQSRPPEPSPLKVRSLPSLSRPVLGGNTPFTKTYPASYCPPSPRFLLARGLPRIASGTGMSTRGYVQIGNGVIGVEINLAAKSARGTDAAGGRIQYVYGDVVRSSDGDGDPAGPRARDRRHLSIGEREERRR